MTSVALQPVIADHDSIPHMEAMLVSFHMGYGGLIYCKRLQGDRPKCKGMLADPRAFPKHVEIGLFVPSLSYTYPSENFNFFWSYESYGCPLLNEIW